MKKIITALSDENDVEILRANEHVEIINKNILYIDGVFELLDVDDSIEYVVIDEDSIGSDFEEFKWKCEDYNVIFLFLANEFKDYDYIHNIEVFYDIEGINNFFNGKPGQAEIRKAKRIISFLGANGVGKTTISSIIANKLSCNYKVIIIDFDIIEENLTCLFDIKKVKNPTDSNYLIKSINQNLDVLYGLRNYFNENNIISKYKVKALIEELKSEYDYVVIDSSNENNLKYMKTVIPNCDYNFFIIEGNFMELKKARRLMEMYIFDYEVEIDKIGILINKKNIYSIEEGIIRRIFDDMDIIELIDYERNMNSYINGFARNLSGIKCGKKILLRMEGE